jgi:hypothetical protein
MIPVARIGRSFSTALLIHQMALLNRIGALQAGGER